jgi:hypothetical protein
MILDIVELACMIASQRDLDFDDLRPHPCHEARRCWACNEVGEVEDFVPVEKMPQPITH